MRRDTWVYLSAYSLSLLGNGIATVLFPLLVLARTGDVLAAGVVASVTAAVAAMAGALGGVVVDRVNRRTVAIVSDLLSAGSIAALPVVDAVWGLDLGWFITLSVIGAFGDMPGMTAREAMLPRLVRSRGSDDLARLMGMREALAGVLMIVGPAAGGLLVGLAGVGAIPLLITAGTSTCAALVTCALDPKVGSARAMADGVGSAPIVSDGEVDPLTDTDRRSRRSGRRVTGDLAEAWWFALRTPLVRGTTLLMALLAGVVAAHQMTLMPAYFTAMDRPGLSGIAATGIACGGILGAILFAAGSGRIARRTWFVLGTCGMTLGLVVVGLLPGPWIVIGGLVLVGLGNGPVSAVLRVAAVEAIPDAMRGRVLGVQNSVVLAAPALTAAPFAALAGGQGLRTAAIILAAGTTVGLLAALIAPTFRTLSPEPANGTEPEPPDLVPDAARGTTIASDREDGPTDGPAQRAR
jgi:MFS family permease